MVQKRAVYLARKKVKTLCKKKSHQNCCVRQPKTQIMWEHTLKFNFNVIRMWSLFFCLAHVVLFLNEYVFTNYYYLNKVKQNLLDIPS